MEQSMTFDKRVKDAMSKNADQALVGGLWQGRAYKHIYKDMKSNFIEEKFPENCNLKGYLSTGEIKYHRGASHMNSSQALTNGAGVFFSPTPITYTPDSCILIARGV